MPFSTNVRIGMKRTPVERELMKRRTWRGHTAGSERFMKNTHQINRVTNIAAQAKEIKKHTAKEELLDLNA